MLAREEEVEVDVRKEDQLKINEFGQNNARLVDIRGQMDELRKQLETYDDASAEIMMGDDEPIQLMISESFVECSEDFATEYIEELVQKATSKLDNLTKEDEKLEARQNALKKTLYGRFGKSINLD